MCTRCVPANTLTVSETAAELKVSGQANLARINFDSLPARQMSSGWGDPTADLQARLGHSTANAALLYQNTAKGRDRMIAESLSKLVSE